MIEEKANSLNKALLYSYQSATAVLSDGREFRCLINSNNVSMEVDDKMLSIPCRDICLNKTKPDGAITSTGKEEIGVKCGDVIQWKENGTRWIVYSRYLHEVAYFRGMMRQCAQEPIIIDGQEYWFYLKGPDEKGIDWQKTKHFIFNDLNYTVEIYISKNEKTKQFFQRFAKCKILGRNFEVQAADDLSTEGILTVYLKEDYANVWEEAQQEIPEEEIPEIEEQPATFDLRRSAPIAQIIGPTEVYPYDTVSYSIEGVSGGKWLLSNSRAKLVSYTDSTAIIEITTGKSGSVSLIYKVGDTDIVFNIKVLSL